MEGKERGREKKGKREEVGGTEGAEGDQDQAGRGEHTDSGGTMT